MLTASSTAKFSLESRLVSRWTFVLGLGAVGLGLASVLGAEWRGTGWAAGLGGLLFALGLLTGHALSQRANRAARPAPPVVASAPRVPYRGCQPQEIRCNPFFELLSSSSL